MHAYKCVLTHLIRRCSSAENAPSVNSMPTHGHKTSRAGNRKQFRCLLNASTYSSNTSESLSRTRRNTHHFLCSKRLLSSGFLCPDRKTCAKQERHRCRRRRRHCEARKLALASASSLSRARISITSLALTIQLTNDTHCSLQPPAAYKLWTHHAQYIRCTC